MSETAARTSDAERVPRPPVSAVVPFRGDASAGRGALAALGSLGTLPGDELLLVDNTERGVLGGSGPAGVRVLEAPREQSAYHARNVGAAAAAGEWILFMDADCIAPPDLIDRYFDPPPGPRIGFLAGELSGVAVQAPLAARWSRSRRGFRSAQHAEVGPYPAGVTGNMIVRRAAFEAAGGFHDGLRSDADVELCWRLQELGWEMGYRPSALVEHADPERLGDLVRQALVYGAGRRWTDRRHPRWKNRPRLAAPTLRGIAAAGAWLLGARFERARFSLIDIAWAWALWWGYVAVSNRAATRGQPPARGGPPRMFVAHGASLDGGRLLADPLRHAEAGHAVRVEASRRPARPAGELPAPLELRFAEDDPPLGAAFDLWRLSLRFPRRRLAELRAARRDRRAGIGALPSRALAGAARRLIAEGRSRVRHVDDPAARAHARRLALLTGRASGDL